MHLPDDLWSTVQASVPVLCVDVVPVRRSADGLEVGLIRRHHPDGHLVWCHVGGRVRRGETVADAIGRHVDETLEGADLRLDPDPQPDHVSQWFPADLRRDPDHGLDPRQHAVSLCFALDLGPSATARPGGEGETFAWFGADLAGADPLWPGVGRVVERTVAGLSARS